MKTKDICAISTAAFATAALTVATFHTSLIEAGSDADSPPPKIEQPKLVSHGVQFTLAPQGGRTFKAGDRPVFDLRAVNTTKEEVSEPVWISLTGGSMAEMLSRIARPEPVMWQDKQIFTLKANETKTIALSPGTNLPPDKLFSVRLSDFDPAAPRVSMVKSPTPQPVVSPATWPITITAFTFSTLTNAHFPPVAAPPQITVTKR